MPTREAVGQGRGLARERGGVQGSPAHGQAGADHARARAGGPSRSRRTRRPCRGLQRLDPAQHVGEGRVVDRRAARRRPRARCAGSSGRTRSRSRCRIAGDRLVRGGDGRGGGGRRRQPRHRRRRPGDRRQRLGARAEQRPRDRSANRQAADGDRRTPTSRTRSRGVRCAPPRRPEGAQARDHPPMPPIT